MSQRDRKRRHKTKHPVGRWVIATVVVCFVAGLAAVGAFAAYVVHLANQVPSIDTMHVRLPGSPSAVYADNGRVRLGYMQTDIVRFPLKQSQQPSMLRDATVAIEDRNFWHHGAVDYEALVRAAIADVFHSSSGEQGGSTLTMQLVKNTYPYLLRISASRSLKYKVAEAKLATQLYQHHGRAWILTQYLNDIQYTTVGGQNAIGVEAASQMLFNKPASKLDLAQMALLAGLPQAPTAYNPFNDPGAAKERRNLVLQAMVRSHYITHAQANTAAAQPLGLHQGSVFTRVSQPYVFNYVQTQLLSGLRKAGYSKPEAQEIIDQGGLKIYTTINLADQEYAKQAIQTNEPYSDDPESSLVSIDPSNGHILAMQNSTTYGDGKGETTFNAAAQAQRQTGSVFKAFVLMTLIHDWDGNPNETYYNSSPLPAGWLSTNPTWAVANAADGDSQGVINVTRATTQSINAVYAQLGVDVGMTNVTKMANAMGLDDPYLKSYPSEAIGGLNHGVSSLQVANAYATIADGGVEHDATIISKVVLPNGKVVDLGHPKGHRVFSQGQAYAATQVLETVLSSPAGTAYGSSYGCPAAGKTGTTDNYTDAWFSGFSPQLETAVWVGYPREDEYMDDVNGLGPGFGGTLAAPIWKDFMSKASNGYCGDFTPPAVPWTGKPYFGAHSKTASAKTYSGTGTTGKGTLGTGTTNTGTGNTGTTTTGTGTTPAKTTGGGNGNGNGNGGGKNGNGNGSGGAPPATDPAPP